MISESIPTVKNARNNCQCSRRNRILSIILTIGSYKKPPIIDNCSVFILLLPCVVSRGSSLSILLANCIR